jgi:hypothetical protein
MTIRRPGPLYRWDGSYRARIEIDGNGRATVLMSPVGLETSKDLRRLAVWLERAAAWIDTRRHRPAKSDEGITP